MGLFDKLKRNKQSEETSSEENTFTEVSENKNHTLDFDDFFKKEFLENEAKFRHQDVDIRRSTDEEPITLEYIFKELLGIPPTDIGGMTIVSRSEFGKKVECRSIEDFVEVLTFNPFDAILYTTENGEKLPRKAQNTTLVISYRPGDRVWGDKENKKDKSILMTDNSIIMFLRGIGLASPTLFMRISVMIPNFSNPDDFRILKSKNIPYTKSFVLGHDIENTTNYVSQYNEIEKSLIEKSRRGEELNDDERTVLSGITYSKNLGHDFGYATWLMGQSRFSDALIYFQKAYEHLKTSVVTDFERVHEIFAEICFGIGFCFSELGEYDRAIYYLGLIQPENRNKYIMEYINALVNARDPRAYTTIRNYIDQFSTHKREVDSPENGMFYNFLFRRLAYIYIEYKMWDNARDLLEQLKNNPDCKDFALSELEYLQSIGH